MIQDQNNQTLHTSTYQFGRVNFPNSDMIGHIGDFAATVKACEVTAECVGKLIEAVNAHNGTSIILADHGNTDKMIK